MINRLYHSGTDTTIQFPGPALRESSESHELYQNSGHDSARTFFCYSRNQVHHAEYALVYSRVPTAVLDALYSFLQSRNGDKNTFTWYDENGDAHTVHFATGHLESLETNPGLHRCRFTLAEKPTGATLITGTETDWDAVAGRSIDVTPIWILRTLFEGVQRDISDSAWQFPASSLNGFTTTLPLVAQWGQIRENISGYIGEMLISDFNITLLVDQDDDNSIYHLALRDAIEKNPVDLYLTFAELDPLITAPRLMFRGNVKDVDIPDQTQVNLVIEDETAKLQQYLGTRISSEVYPLCDPDVVGKLIPIVYGSVSKLPALCVESGWVTSLKSDISASQTTIDITELPAGKAVYNTQIIIDDEIMTITSGRPPETARRNYALSSLGANTAGSIANDTRYSMATINNGTRRFSGVDGWYSSDAANSGIHWGQINFKFPVVVDEVRFYNISDDYVTRTTDPDITTPATLYQSASFKIYLLLLDGTYQEVYSTTTCDKACVIATFAGITAKGVQINLITGRRDGQGWNMVELEAYGVEYVDTNPVTTSLSVLRGQGGFPAAVHTKGSTVMQKMLPTEPLVYLLADHFLDAIGNIVARVRGVDVDITSDVSKYLGTAGSQLAKYPGKAAITIPDFAKVNQRISLSLDGDPAAVDPLHGHAPDASVLTAFGPQTASGASGTLIAKNWIVSAADNIAKKDFVSIIQNVTFPDPGGVIDTGATTTMSLVVNFQNQYHDWSPFPTIGLYIQSNGYRISDIYALDVHDKTDWTIPLNYYSAAAKQGNTVSLVMYFKGNGTNNSYNIVVYGTIKSGTRSGKYSPQTIAVKQNYSGVSVNKGTLQLNGNSVADVMVGDMILADVTRNITAPADVIDDLLSTYCGDTSLVQEGTLPASYNLNGAITEYKRTIEWLDYLAFQSKCWFRKINGVSKLIVRHATPVSPAVIPACCLNSEGMRELSYKKAPITDVINIINVLYDRDWSNTGKTAEAYQHSWSSTNNESVDNYGPLEQPNMFMFDFVTGQGMAADLATFFHEFFAVRKWFVSYSTFLNHINTVFASEVQLAFARDLTGIIIEAGLQPGSLNTIDTIRFTAAVTHLPPEIANAVTTLDGDYIHAKDGEVMTYV